MPPNTLCTRAILALGVPKSIFAAFIGVDPSVLEAWTWGETTSGPARRIFEEIIRDPEHWKAALSRCVEITTPPN